MSEYQMLRDEIIANEKSVVQYYSVTYASTVAILTFALAKKEFFFCLIPYIAIIPLYLASESLGNNTCRIASYLYVFYEGNDFMWETRSLQFINKKRNWKGISSHYFLSITCSLLAAYKLFKSCYDCREKCIGAIIILLITIISILVMEKSTVNFSSDIELMIKKWEQIKKIEQSKAEDFLVPRNARTERVVFRMSPKEIEDIQRCADVLKINRVNVIVEGINLLKEQLNIKD